MQKIESLFNRLFRRQEEKANTSEYIDTSNMEKVSDRRILWQVAHGHDRTSFNSGWYTDRGLFELFGGTNQGNYSQLGEFQGESAEIFYRRIVEKEAIIGEFAVGEGTFLRELQEKFRTSDAVRYIGFDLFRQQHEYLFEFIQANIMFLLSPQIRKQLEAIGLGEKSLDVVSCAALFHHLDHNLLAFAQLCALVKKGGRIYVSSMPRLIRPSDNGVGNALDDERGNLLPEFEVIKEEVVYARNTLPARFVDGSIAAPAQVWDLFNTWNENHWQFEYSISNPKKLDSCISGRVVAESKTGEDLDLDWIFYGKLPNETKLSYILARTEQEKNSLIQRGFTSISKIILLIRHLGELQYDYRVYDRHR